MKRIILMYMALLLLTGCGGRSDGWQTGEVSLVQTAGVDRTEWGVRVSAAVEGRQAQDVQTVAAEGLSVAEGVQTLRRVSGGTLHFGHTGQLLLGEELARQGAEPVLDFVARDRQIGPGVRLWVVKADTAEQALDLGGANVSARLADRGAGGRPKLACTATRLMSVMARGGSVAVPAVRAEGEMLLPEGYAVLRGGRLVGFLDEEQGLGLELLCGHGAGQLVSVAPEEDLRLVLEVERTKLVCVPVFRGGKLSGVRLRCEVWLEVVQGAGLTEEQHRQAEQQARTVLEERAAAAVGRARIWDADFVGLEQMAKEVCSAREWSCVDWASEFCALHVETRTEVRVAWPADVMEEQHYG